MTTTTPTLNTAKFGFFLISKDLHGICSNLEWFQEVTVNEKLYNLLSHYDIPLRIALGVDLRVVLTWDLDMTDLELHVTEPNGERCHSFHNHTTNGLYSKLYKKMEIILL